MGFWIQQLEQVDWVATTLVFVAGMVAAAFIALWHHVKHMRREMEGDIVSRTRPVLTVVPVTRADGLVEGNLELMVKNSGVGPATDLQAEATWAHRQWVSAMPTVVGHATDELVQMLPMAPGKRGKSAMLQVTLRFGTVTGQVGEKLCRFVAAPDGQWFIMHTEEELRDAGRLTLGRGKEALQFPEQPADTEP